MERVRTKHTHNPNEMVHWVMTFDIYPNNFPEFNSTVSNGNRELTPSTSTCMSCHVQLYLLTLMQN